MLPTLLAVGEFRIAAYGTLVALAYLIGILWLRSQIGNMGYTENRFWALVYALFFGAIAGGKLLFVALNWELYASGNMSVLGDFRYGFVFFGGLFGTILMGLAFLRFSAKEFLGTADYFGVILPMGHALGRLGCLAAGCCYGLPTNLPWGLRFTRHDSLVPEELLGVPLHPVQLYEAGGNLLIGLFFRKVLRRIQKGELRRGTAFYGYFLCYAALRFVVELFRGDDRGGFFRGLSPSQWIALAGILAVSALTARNGIWAKASG